MRIRSRAARPSQRWWSRTLLSSPLVGERGSIALARLRRVRGLLPQTHVHRVERTPHPALRATFSHKGRREERLIATISVGRLANFPVSTRRAYSITLLVRASDNLCRDDLARKAATHPIQTPTADSSRKKQSFLTPSPCIADSW